MSCPFSEYRDIFGKPNTGVHSLRLFNIAVLDVIGTIIIAFVTSVLIQQPLWLTLILWMLVAIWMHRIFCVDTTINKMIFGETMTT